MDQVLVQLTEAYQLGRSGYLEGINAPCNDPVVMLLIGSRVPGITPEGEADTVDILDRWLVGWNLERIRHQ